MFCNKIDIQENLFSNIKNYHRQQASRTHIKFSVFKVYFNLHDNDMAQKLHKFEELCAKICTTINNTSQKDAMTNY